MSNFKYPERQLPPDYHEPAPPPRPDPDAEFLQRLEAEDALSDFIATRQATLFSGGDPLFGKQGKAAFDAAPTVLERLRSHRDEIVAQAPPSHRRDLEERLDLHLDEVREEIDRHLGEQRKVWHRRTLEQRQAANRTEAKLYSGDFDKVMLMAGINEEMAGEVAKLVGLEPGSEAAKVLGAQARSRTYRAAVEGALERAGRQACIDLYDKVKNALSAQDRNELGGHIDDQRQRQAAHDYVDKIVPSMPPALVDIDGAHAQATAQNEADFVNDPSQRAANQHVIDIRFGKHKRHIEQAGTELAQAVEDWVATPAADGGPQTERPPSAIWKRLDANQQKAVDERLKRNAFGDMDMAKAEPKVPSPLQLPPRSDPTYLLKKKPVIRPPLIPVFPEPPIMDFAPDKPPREDDRPPEPTGYPDDNSA
jgi:hypothetical protein